MRYRDEDRDEGRRDTNMQTSGSTGGRYPGSYPDSDRTVVQRRGDMPPSSRGRRP